MAALSMPDLVALETQYGFSPDGLTYQQRCARIAKAKKGETYEVPKPAEVKRGRVTSVSPIDRMTQDLRRHPLYGKKLLITPMMEPDKNRALYFDEPVGHDIQVEEMQAGALLYGMPGDGPSKVDRLVGDYQIIRENPSKTVIAKTSLPKSGQEISFTVGKDLVPVVLGNDGQRGYIWSMAPHLRQHEDTMIQLMGLKSLLTTIYPELLPRFSGKPLMSYIDGLTLVASIPLTDAILKEHRQKELRNAALGLG